MSKRTSSSVVNGVKDAAEPCELSCILLLVLDLSLMLFIAVDKQKVLLAGDNGHFSLIKALHLADFITQLNGKLFLSVHASKNSLTAAVFS